MEADRWLRGRASPLVLRRRAPNEAGGECRNRTDRVWFAGPDSAPADSPWSERLESNQPTLVPQTSGPPRAFAQIGGAGGDRTRIAALPARSPPVGRQPHSWSRRGSNSHLYVANVASSRWTTTPFAGRLGIEPSEHGFGDRAPPRGRPIRALDEATSTGRERFQRRKEVRQECTTRRTVTEARSFCALIHDQPDAMAPARRPLRNSNPSHARDRRAATPVASVGIGLPSRDRACLARFRKPRASSRGREIGVTDRDRTGYTRATVARTSIVHRPP